MPVEITMPRLSDTMEEGTLIKWQVKVGDEVSAGDLLAEVETDKATMELQSFDDGTVAKLAVEEGETTSVGSLILVLAEDGESVEDAAAAAGSGESGGERKQASKSQSASGESSDDGDDGGVATATATEEAAPPKRQSGDRIRVSPLARKIAEEHRIDLAKLTGSGPDGRIIKRDVMAKVEGGEEAAAEGAATPVKSITPHAAGAKAAPVELEAKRVNLTNMRKTIARRLVESKTTIPHFTVTVAVNMDPLLTLRETINEQLEPQGIKLSVNDFIVVATTQTLLRHPECNASWAGEAIEQHGTVNIGIAVALPAERGGGLVVPVLRDVQSMPIREISNQTRVLAKKARDSGLSLEEMSDSTLTISNLGMYGVEHFEAIINPPNAAILALGASIEKPVVRGGQIVVGREMMATLSCDHRVIDGAMGAEFLQTFRQLMESPAALLVG